MRAKRTVHGSTPSSLIQGFAFLTVAIALGLSLPGVEVVRAGEPDMTPVSPEDYADYAPAPAQAAPAAGPEACGDEAARIAGDRARAQLLSNIPQPRPGEAGVEAENGVILLNNRGYNYGTGNGPNEAQWQRIEREMLAGPAKP